MSGTHWDVLKTKGIENHPLIQQLTQTPRAQSWQASEENILKQSQKDHEAQNVYSKGKCQRTPGSNGGSRGLNAHNQWEDGVICLRQTSQTWISTVSKRVKLTGVICIYINIIRLEEVGEDVKSNTVGTVQKKVNGLSQGRFKDKGIEWVCSIQAMNLSCTEKLI